VIKFYSFSDLLSRLKTNKLLVFEVHNLSAYLSQDLL